jgi:hypothetical protein
MLPAARVVPAATEVMVGARGGVPSTTMPAAAVSPLGEVTA